MTHKKNKTKRANRTLNLGEAVQSAIDPMFRKRGFANRDLIANWASIAPVPYDKVAIPDELRWPRRQAGAEGAILFLRCADAHRLALAHEGAAIAAAVNRYFGYILVGDVKLSAAPFSQGSQKPEQDAVEPAPELRKAVSKAIAGVEDEGLKEALRKLGHGLMARK